MYSKLFICGPGLISGKGLPVTQSSPSPSSAVFSVWAKGKMFLNTVFEHWITDQYSLECVFGQDFWFTVLPFDCRGLLVGIM